MIDIMVAWDKLTGFETADEIAHFLMDQDVRAVVRSPDSCAISKWMQQVTGNDHIITTDRYIGQCQDYGIEIEIIGNHTEAMTDFVHKFDMECYPNLMDSSYVNGCNGPCCNERK